MSKAITWPDAVERRCFAGAGLPPIGPGDVLPLDELGLTEDEARKKIRDLNLPLRIVSIKDAKAETPAPAEKNKESEE